MIGQHLMLRFALPNSQMFPTAVIAFINTGKSDDKLVFLNNLNDIMLSFFLKDKYLVRIYSSLET